MLTPEELAEIEADLRLCCYSENAPERRMAKTILELWRVIEAAPHEPHCASTMDFIHEEPCLFWTQGVCLTENDIHGVVLDATATCHPCECNCWKSKSADVLESLQRPGDESSDNGEATGVG